MGYFRLGPEPSGKGIDLAQIIGIGNAAFAPRLERIFQRLNAGQFFDNEVRILAELVTLAEISRPVVG